MIGIAAAGAGALVVLAAVGSFLGSPSGTEPTDDMMEAYDAGVHYEDDEAIVEILSEDFL